MDIVRNDFEQIWNDISRRQKGDYSDTVFNDSHYIMSKDSYATGLGMEDERLFFHDKPYTADNYKTMSVSELFHVMNGARLLGMNVPDESPIIDMKKLWTEYEKLEPIVDQFKRIDWYFDYSDDSVVWAKGGAEVNRFIKEMQQHDSPEAKVLLHSLWKENVPEHSVSMPDFLREKNVVMKNEVPAHNERQFNRIGMGDEYNQEIKDKLKTGAQRVEHKFNKSFDGVPVDGTLYLNKGKIDNDYFINKFSLSKMHEKNGQRIDQTFYVNNRSDQKSEGQAEKVHQQWTLKRAFNYLAGRPVYDRHAKSWEQIDLSNKLSNGNYGSHRYGENYGVDLDKILNAYNLSARGSNEKMSQLKEGIERGNLQPVQFNTQEGGMETYKISLSIRTGSLRIYDGNNNEVPLEKQVERNMISDDLKNTLIDIYGKKQKTTDHGSGGKTEKPEGDKLQEEKKQVQAVTAPTPEKQQKENVKVGKEEKDKLKAGDKKIVQRRGGNKSSVKAEQTASGSRKRSHKH